jgi:hypothetical protein
MVLLASDFDKSKYLRAEDLKAEKKFRIKAVTVEVIGDDQKHEQKLVVWFTNDKRGLMLNKTNNRTLRGAFGDDTKAWKEKILVLFPTMVDYRGKLVPGLRVRIPPPKMAAASPAPKPTTPSGNGAGAAAVKPPPTQQTAAAAPADPELDDDPPKSLSEELDDEINF